MLSPTELHAFATSAELEMHLRVEAARAAKERQVEATLKAAIIDFEINQLGLRSARNIQVIEGQLEQFVDQRENEMVIDEISYPRPKSTTNLSDVAEKVNRLLERKAAVLKMHADAEHACGTGLQRQEIRQHVDPFEPGCVSLHINDQADRISSAVSFRLHAFNARLRDAVFELSNQSTSVSSEFTSRKEEQTRLIVAEYRRQLRKVLILNLGSVTAVSHEPIVGCRLGDVWKGKKVPKSHKIEVLAKILERQANNSILSLKIRDVLLTS